MKLTHVIASATAAALLGTAGVSIAGAASSGGSPPAASSTSPTTTAGTAEPHANAAAPARAGRRLLRRLRRGGVRLAARTIGIKPADLVKELRAGKTIADVATEHGVQPQAVVDAIVQAADAKISAAQSKGKLTAARAAKLEQRVATIVPKLVNQWHPKAKAAAAS